MALRAFVCLVAAVALQAAPQQPVFKSGVDYVALDVVVTDKHDTPVKDLTKDDFEIVEHGRPQTIADFRFEFVPATRRSVPIRTAAPSVDVMSNTHAPNGRQWVLVIDDLHIYEQNIVQTKAVIQDFLEQLSPDDQVAVVFVGRSDLSQPFTSDLGAQLRTVNRIKDALGFAEDPPPFMGDTRRMRCASRYGNARSTVTVVENITAALIGSTFPRRALVYVSQGLDYDFSEVPHANPYASLCPNEQAMAEDVWGRLIAAFTRAHRAGVPVYSVDPRGLHPEEARRSFGSGGAYLELQLTSLRALAQETGGRAFVRRNMVEAVRELIEDNSSYYLLGYYPNPAARDGKFHDVEVRVKRPDLKVRAKAGYMAPVPAAVSAAAAKSTLDDVLSAALPASGLEMRAFAAPVAPTARGMTAVVTVEVVYPAPLDGSKIDDELQFGLVALDNDGAVKARTNRAFHFTGTPRPGDAAITFALNEKIDVPSQPLTLRIAAVSRTLGTAGAVHMPLEVIKPEAGRVQVSAVVLGLDGPPRQATMPPGALGGLVPFQPTVARAFAPTQTLRVFAPLFWSSKDSTAELTLVVRREDAEVRRIAATVNGTPTGAGDHRRGAFETTIPLAGLSPGTYLLEVRAALAKGQPFDRVVAFEVK